jgi:hypothetical protein
MCRADRALQRPVSALPVAARGRGGIGRRKGLKIPQLRLSGFDPRRPHHIENTMELPQRMLRAVELERGPPTAMLDTCRVCRWGRTADSATEFYCRSVGEWHKINFADERDAYAAISR